MLRRLLALTVAAWLVSGCVLPGDFDWMLVVANNSDRNLYLRVPLSTDPDETLYRVANVPAGVIGPSVAWFGKPNNEVRVLDENCRDLGAFETTPDPSVAVSVPGVPGLTGHVEPYGVVEIDDDEPIQSTDDCGASCTSERWGLSS